MSEGDHRAHINEVKQGGILWKQIVKIWKKWGINLDKICKCNNGGAEKRREYKSYIPEVMWGL